MLQKLTAFLTSFIFLFALVIKDASALPKSPFLGLTDESSASIAHPFLTDAPSAKLIKPSAGLPISPTPAFDVSLDLSSVALGEVYSGMEIFALILIPPLIVGAAILGASGYFTVKTANDHSSFGYGLLTALSLVPPGFTAWTSYIIQYENRPWYQSCLGNIITSTM